jgi:lipid-binding SYLF domain-containing protein
MRIRSILALAATLAAFGAGSAMGAEDKAAKQAEIKKATATALEKFYKEKPELKADVAKAPGYAVFTSYGMSFVIGGAGGPGLAHDKATGKDTYMKMAQASAGLQAGISQDDVLIVFRDATTLKTFLDKGWEVGAGAAASTGAKDKSAGGGAGEIPGANYYTLTKNGLTIGGNVTGNKFWKEKDLN